MKCLKGIILACIFLCSTSQGVEKLIAENPLIVVKIKSFNDLKGLVPEVAQQQVMMAEMMAPYLDKTKEAVVVLTSIMPPMAYAAVPVSEGTQLDAITPALPPNLQATAQLKDGYVYLPFTGLLPQNIGKGKFAKLNDSAVQISFDIDRINKTSGPMIAMMLQQDFSAMLPQIDENTDKLMKASIELYKAYLMDLMTATNIVDIDINKKSTFVIDVAGEFKEGSTWAGICEKHSKMKIPECDSLDSAPVVFAGEIDYSSMEPLMEPMTKYMAALGDSTEGKDLNKMMQSFIEMGRLKMVGNMVMDMENFDINYLFEAKEGFDMNKSLSDWAGFFPKGNGFGMYFEKTGDKIFGEEIYKSDMGEAYKQPGMPEMTTLFYAKKNKMYYASSKEGLEKLSDSKISSGTSNGFFFMQMDMGKMGPQATGGIAMPFELPLVEILAKSSKNKMFKKIIIR